MPAMGDSVAEGTVLEWHKQEGDTVASTRRIVEISTDKVDAEVPSPAAGTIVKIHAAEGDTVAVGAVLAEISTNGGDVARRGSNPGLGRVAARHARGGRRRRRHRGRGRRGRRRPRPAQTIDIVTPTGGESVTEGTILEWAVKVGDAVKQGDTVVEISTDKVDMELPAPGHRDDHRDPRRGGRDRHRRPGDRADERRRRAHTAPPRPRRPRPPPADGRTAAPPDGAHASPVARRVAAQQGVDLAGVTGTARGGADHQGRRARGQADGGNGASAAGTAPAARRAARHRAAPRRRPPAPS